MISSDPVNVISNHKCPHCQIQYQTSEKLEGHLLRMHSKKRKIHGSNGRFVTKSPAYDVINCNDYHVPKPKLPRKHLYTEFGCQDTCRTSNCTNFDKSVECIGCKSTNCKNNALTNGCRIPHKIEKSTSGFGVFAAESIKKECFVGEYVGEVIDEAECRKRQKEKKGDYLMQLASKPNIYIDANNKGNFTRFINHNCSPNCNFQSWTAEDSLRAAIYSTKDIKEGEELTVNYSKPIPEGIPCQCKATKIE